MPKWDFNKVTLQLLSFIFIEAVIICFTCFSKFLRIINSTFSLNASEFEFHVQLVKYELLS